MGRFLQGGNFAFFVSRLKKLCWTAVAKPKPIFSTVLSSACLVKYTTTPPNLHQFTALHCAVLRANIALQKYLYSAVQCSELVQDCWCGSVLNKAWAAQNSWENWPSKWGLATEVQHFFQVTQKRKKFPFWGTLPIWPFYSKQEHCWASFDSDKFCIHIHILHRSVGDLDWFWLRWASECRAWINLDIRWNYHGHAVML